MMRLTLSGPFGIAAALVLAACAAAPTRYYTLSSGALLTASTQATNQAAQSRTGSALIHFEVAPVGVPDRLARPQMVVRSESDGPSTRLDVLEQHRWSSPFDSELRDALATAIASRLGAVDVTRGGRLAGQPVYRVAVQLLHFAATLNQQVDASFGWTITRSDDGRNAICQTAASQAIGADMDELVQGVQRVVASAADRIAAQITQLQADRTAQCALKETPGRLSSGGRGVLPLLQRAPQHLAGT